MIIKENLVGCAVRIVSWSSTGKVKLRGIVRVLGVIGSAFMVVIEATASKEGDDTWSDLPPGALFSYSLGFDESNRIELDDQC